MGVRTLGRVVSVLAVLAAAVLLGAGAVLLAALATDHADRALLAGGLVELGVAAGGLTLVLRRSPRRRYAATGGALLLVALSAVAVLLPLSRPAPAPAPVTGQAWWQLPSGSHIRYAHVAPPTGSTRPDPVVFLHGGPGIADLAGDSAYDGRLAADGFDVYAYDELGAGASTRTADPTRYGLTRDVADLEQIRREIGADRMILVGHSYGGALAAHYLAAHPDRVARLVLLSPAPLDPADASSGNLTSRLDTGQRLGLYLALAPPRAELAYGLLQVNPRAAHDYFPDDEADARNDLVYRRSEPALHCPGAGLPYPPVHATGFYRLQYPQSAAAPSQRDIRPRLAGLTVPTLVVKGSCDYLSWHSALDYRQNLPQSALVYLPGAGHNVYQDRPATVLSLLRSFLTGAPLPLPPYAGTAVPAGYEGPG
jgi:proline iminopeptidase